MHDIRAARGALAASREHLLTRANVVATGVGFKESGGRRTGEVGIVCSVERKLPVAELAPADLVPRSIDGVPTDVVPTGAFRALSAQHRERHRPVPGGVSVGHRDITAGTLGCVVYRDGQPFILSNNHVLADTNGASLGDPIVQPAPYDGGQLPADTIASLEAFVPIIMLEEESGCRIAGRAAAVLNGIARMTGSSARLKAVTARAADNLVDAALALPLDDGLLADELLGVGRVEGPGSVELGMAVTKSGRTTGVTSGEVIQVEVTAHVHLGNRVARFADQFMAGPMSQGGDSGSLIVDAERRGVGLLFAGSGRTTLCNRIDHVLELLDVSL